MAADAMAAFAAPNMKAGGGMEGGFVPAPPPVIVPGPVVPDMGCQGTQPQVTITLVDWCGEDYFAQAGEPATVPEGQQGWLFRRAAGFAPATGGKLATLPDWACQIFGAKPGYWASVAIGSIYVIACTLDSLLNFFTPEICGGGVMTPLYALSSFMGVAERWVGTDFGPARQSLQQQMNFLCPQTQIGPSEAIPAFLHGRMDQGTAANYCKIIGWCPEKTAAAIDAARWRPSPADLINWRNWGCLSQLVTLDTALKNLGMIDDTERASYVCASYTPLGVGEIYRLLHLCRPGGPAGRPSYTQADATADLRKLGYSDRDIPYMLFLARTDLNHRQITQPFYQGQITEDDFTSYLMDDGYDSADIATLMPFYRAQALEWTARTVGVPTVKEVVDGLAAGTMTPEVADSILGWWPINPSLEKLVGNEALTRRQMDVRAAGIKAVNARLKSGELTAGDAVSALLAYQVPPDAAQMIVDEWSIAAEVASKPIGVGQLCTLATNGIIGVSEYQQRLRALGYQAAAIDRIMRMCQLTDEIKKQKQEAQAAAKRVSAEQKAASQALALAKARMALAAKKIAAVQKDADQLFTQTGKDIGSAKEQLASVKARSTLKGATLTEANAAEIPPAVDADVPGYNPS